MPCRSASATGAVVNWEVVSASWDRAGLQRRGLLSVLEITELEAGAVADAFQRCYNRTMVKRLQAIGNSSGLILDKPILELLKITPETELDISTDGERLIITPIRDGTPRMRKLARAQTRTLKAHAETFRKLAK